MVGARALSEAHLRLARQRPPHEMNSVARESMMAARSSYPALSRSLARPVSVLHQHRALHQVAATRSALTLARQQSAPLFAARKQQQQQRSVQTAPTSKDGALDLLNQQRALRPSSPHFTIYQPQLTWLSSIANRVTGTGLSVALYALLLGNIALPALGVPFDSATIIATFTSLPAWFQGATKFIFSWPFFFHTFNGFRHLAWDAGYVLSLKSSYTAGYAVIGASIVATLGFLAFV